MGHGNILFKTVLWHWKKVVRCILCSICIMQWLACWTALLLSCNLSDWKCETESLRNPTSTNVLSCCVSNLVLLLMDFRLFHTLAFSFPSTPADPGCRASSTVCTTTHESNSDHMHELQDAADWAVDQSAMVDWAQQGRGRKSDVCVQHLLHAVAYLPRLSPALGTLISPTRMTGHLKGNICLLPLAFAYVLTSCIRGVVAKNCSRMWEKSWLPP